MEDRGLSHKDATSLNGEAIKLNDDNIHYSLIEWRAGALILKIGRAHV